VAFPRNLLADHEKLVFERRPHWIALVPAVMWTILAFAVMIVGNRIFDDPDQDTIRSVLQGLAIFVWLIFGVASAVRWYFTMFVLTSDRLITRKGVIAKHSKEIPLERINDVAFNQSVFERMLGAGDLMIESAGERGQELISDVRHPEQVQLMIYKEAENNNNRMFHGSGGADAAAAVAARQEQTIPEQIEELAALKDKGIITEADFQTKKQELLKRL
jgi:uncharacterized membrane protein YdbT with pleckstrin-like domain